MITIVSSKTTFAHDNGLGRQIIHEEHVDDTGKVHQHRDPSYKILTKAQLKSRLDAYALKLPDMIAAQIVMDTEQAEDDAIRSLKMDDAEAEIKILDAAREGK